MRQRSSGSFPGARPRVPASLDTHLSEGGVAAKVETDVAGVIVGVDSGVAVRLSMDVAVKRLPLLCGDATARGVLCVASTSELTDEPLANTIWERRRAVPAA
eukprot:TRINITY_DN14074_c0_g1_i3.p2 TRINITY_DN14074_c0_g1~~TRINITY_DN14074_c0_g1_i3.p2  ORF type:complete len:102 (-),score=7.42 TRINITY_DN14074_c0_g1_i3:131-436(-)